jgi:tetratricopeptide (TPR) repeat protein
VSELEAKGAGRSAEETASLGALLLRLRKTRPGAQDYDEAIHVLEEGRRRHPRDFFILANLATAYQLTGRLDAAASLLQDAIDAAPSELRAFERYHLLLLRQRANEQITFGLAPLDRLFVGPDRSPVKFVGPGGEWEIGKLADSERAKLPNGSVEEAQRIIQQLLLWFPDDARLLWQYAELANAAGDLKAAATAMGQAVYNFRLSTPALKERRFLLQEAVAWRDVLSRAGKEDQQLAWLLGALGTGVPFGAAQGSTPSVIEQTLNLPRPKDLLGSGMFMGTGIGGNSPSEPEAATNWLARLGWPGWTVIGLATGLVMLLAGLQMREWRRRAQQRRAIARSAASS